MDLKIGSEYNGFVVVGNYHFKEDQADGVYLRHKKSGLEVFHILDGSKENGFAFAFRTVAKNSKGNAHILEHSVLCGSENYNLKEPFTTLNNQGVLTFSNAFTYPEKTVYPASSVVKKDYFTAFDVYADAVFFPTLSKQTFMQEGWRVEFDENNNPSIQGVVYNEMKGAYSNAIQLKFDGLLASMYPDSYYKYDSGGDPINIPELSYEDFVAFHDKFYSPSNCLVVVMGNISTEEQLDHINDTLTDRLIGKYGETKFHKNNVSKVPTDIKKLLEVKSITEPIEANVDIIGNPSDGVSVNLAFATELDDVKMAILDGLLYNESTSPFVKGLLDNCEIGSIGSLNGKLGTGYNRNVFNINFDNVEPGSEQKAFDIIKNVINDVVNTGFDQKSIDSVIMKEQMSCRKKNRYSGGPLSLSLAINIIDNWMTGADMARGAESIEELEAVEAEIKENPNVVMDWFKQVFIDNKSVLKFVAYPGTIFTENREAQERKLVEKLVKRIDKEPYEKELKELHDYQEKVETEDELACIPRSSINDLSEDMIQDVETIVTSTRNHMSKVDVPTLINKEHTYGLTKLEVMLPVNNLSPSDLKYLPLIEALASDMGTTGKSWEEVANERANCMSFFVGLDSYGTSSKILQSKQIKNIGNRLWLSACGTFLNKKTTDAMTCIADFINNVSFKDTERFQAILKNYVSSYKENMPNDNNSMINRVLMERTVQCAQHELFEGVSYSKFVMGLDTDNTKPLQKKLDKLLKKIRKQGVLFHIVTDEDMSQNLEFLAEDIDARPPKASKNYDIKKYLKCAYYPKEYDPKDVLTIKTDVLVGFAARSFETNDDYGSVTSICRKLIFNHMGMHQLWEKVRTINGAYGAHAVCSIDSGISYFTSYRDPNPTKSLDLFKESVDDLKNKQLTKDDLERSVLSKFGDFTIPKPAFSRGESGLVRTLRGESTKDIHNNINTMLKVVTVDDLNHEVNRIKQELSWNNPKQLVVVPKSDETTKNVIEL